MRKRKYREKHIAAYGAALLDDHTSPECAIASMGAVAWSSSDDLSCHSFIDGSDTSDLQGHKKTKRLKITDVKEVVWRLARAVAYVHTALKRELGAQETEAQR